MKTIDAQQVKLPDEIVDNIRLIVDKRFQGIKVYCLQRRLDIADYLHAFKWGAFPHRLIAHFLDDKILIQSRAYLFNAYPDLVDCALHRLKRESGETRFCMEYEIDTLTYLAFFNKYIFDPRIHEALVLAGYWKDAVATVYNIPSDILSFPTVAPIATPEESLEVAKDCLYTHKQQLAHFAKVKRARLTSKTQQEPITEELEDNPEPQEEPESKTQQEPETTQQEESKLTSPTRPRRTKKSQLKTQQPTKPKETKETEEERQKRLELEEWKSKGGRPTRCKATPPPEGTPKLRRQIKKGDKYSHSSDYVMGKYHKDALKYGVTTAEIRKLLHEHYGVLPQFCELYSMHYNMFWKHIIGAQFSLAGAQALKMCGIIPNELLVEFYKTNYPKRFRLQTEDCV